MQVGDLVTFIGGSKVGLVFKVWKDPAFKDLQVEVLYPAGFWRQSIKNLEVISESR